MSSPRKEVTFKVPAEGGEADREAEEKKQKDAKDEPKDGPIGEELVRAAARLALLSRAFRPVLTPPPPPPAPRSPTRTGC